MGAVGLAGRPAQLYSIELGDARPLAMVDLLREHWLSVPLLLVNRKRILVPCKGWNRYNKANQAEYSEETGQRR